MADRLFADFGALDESSSRLECASSNLQARFILPGGIEPRLGSASVADALRQSSALHAAHAEAAASLLSLEAGNVREAVLQMAAADRAAAAQVAR